MKSIHEQGRDINELVHQFFCFGSTNKGINKDTQKKFHQFLRMVTNVFGSFCANVDKPNIADKTKVRKKIPQTLHENVYKLISHTRFIKWHLASNEYFIQQTNDCAMFPLQLLTDGNSPIWNLTQQVYPTVSTRMTRNWTDNIPQQELKTVLYQSLLPNIAEYIWLLDLTEEDITSEDNTEKTRYLCLNKIHDLAQLSATTDFISLLDKQFYERNFKFMIKDVKRAVLKYGYGACEIMADAALLLALDLELPGKLTYLRFKNSRDTNIEELNAIAIGNWPEKDTLIICPWVGEKGNCFIWQGSLENTPELSTGNYRGKYDRSIVKFQVENEETKMALRQQVREAGINSWLTNEIRLTNLEKIRESTYRFIAALELYGYIPKTDVALSLVNS